MNLTLEGDRSHQPLFSLRFFFIIQFITLTMVKIIETEKHGINIYVLVSSLFCIAIHVCLSLDESDLLVQSIGCLAFGAASEVDANGM